jgi:hypothetical protein
MLVLYPRLTDAFVANLAKFKQRQDFHCADSSQPQVRQAKSKSPQSSNQLFNEQLTELKATYSLERHMFW